MVLVNKIRFSIFVRSKILSGFLIFAMAICIFETTTLKAQTALTSDEIDEYRAHAEQLVSFLQFTYNTIGDPEVSVKDKDIIINQSYSKFFESDKVQIEDDLVEEREIPINKDVQAYLKDIDFFYQEVAFEFRIEEISQEINEKNQLFFKIRMNRNLQGITIEGDTVNTNRVRYVEINLNDAQKDLKIASIYTTKLNEKEELRKWWNDLPMHWKEIFGGNIALADTIRMKDVLWFNDSIAWLDFLTSQRMSRDTLSLAVTDTLKIILNDTAWLNTTLLDRQLKKIIGLDTININAYPYINSLDPLSKLVKLKRLDCSNTSISDLMPLRNLTHLQYLDCSNTGVESIEALRYSNEMEHLYFSKTSVTDIATVTNFDLLETLHFNQTAIDSLNPIFNLFHLTDLECASTLVNDITPLGELTKLERIDFSNTMVNDIEALKKLKAIYFLKFDDTPIKNLQPLKDLASLRLLFIDNTPVYDISPLSGLPELNRIYCDHTGVTRKVANIFMEENPGVLVIYESVALINWWTDLPEDWKTYFSDYVSVSGKPEKEELHEITKIKTIDISGIMAISTLEPLENLAMLNDLDCSTTGINNLEALRELADLNTLNFSNTAVADISVLSSLSKLEELRFDNTQVDDIEPIMHLDDLKLVYCDNTPVDEAWIMEFIIGHPGCQVIYQTETLEQWWAGVPEVWKMLASKFINTKENLTREQLHQIARLRRIDIADFPEMSKQSMQITSLEHINKLAFLEELSFTNTNVTSLEPLRAMNTIRVLHCPNNPIVSIEPLSEVKNLEDLDVKNTPIDNLEFLSTLDGLKILNCSGTNIKSLKGLEYLVNLEELECHNTGIKNLKFVQNLENLNSIKCYNTRISQRTIDKFNAARPDVEVIYY
jgi:hypothetical protein